jgi:alkanesulfonate monooxygenase SsuD/methylene tetrahydromethanopterin reductase-like flavin-dependent oxidoreductase (luciferase family)
VLELHGWGELQEELNAMTKRGEWDKLPDAVDDEVLNTFAVIGTPEEAVAEIKRRYGDVVTRMTLFAGDDEGVAMVEALRGASRSGAGPGPGTRS